MGIPGAATASELGDLVECIARSFEYGECPLPASNKEAIAFQVMRLYEAGTTDANEIRRQLTNQKGHSGEKMARSIPVPACQISRNG